MNLKPCPICKTIKQDQLQDGSCYECLLIYWMEYILIIGHEKKVPTKTHITKVDNIFDEILEIRTKRDRNS